MAWFDAMNSGGEVSVGLSPRFAEWLTFTFYFSVITGHVFIAYVWYSNQIESNAFYVVLNFLPQVPMEFGVLSTLVFLGQRARRVILFVALLVGLVASYLGLTGRFGAWPVAVLWTPFYQLLIGFSMLLAFTNRYGYSPQFSFFPNEANLRKDQMFHVIHLVLVCAVPGALLGPTGIWWLF